jgi:prepilin-type N-terminal cleavage/methylation domain-containing protein
MKQIAKKQGGFTLIEVVLVLAIGALIILMALLAFTGAQRARRDTARTNLVGTIQSSVEQYAANSSGDYPDATDFAGLVTTNKWKDPNGGAIATTGTVPSPGILYLRGASCSGTAITSGSGTTVYAIQYKQENGQTVCKSNTQ